MDALPPTTARTKRIRVMIEIAPDASHVHVSELSMGRWNRISKPDLNDVKIMLVLEAMLNLEIFLNRA